jgi:hypothetical protein
MSSEKSDSRTAESLIQTGCEMFGSTGGALIGLAIAGPAGAIAGAASAPLITRLMGIGGEFAQRLLGKREQGRLGAALEYAVEKTRENIEAGKETNPALVGENVQLASSDEILESALTAAQRDPQEKKLRYYGNLIGNLPFEKNLDASEAFQLTRLAQELTYRQLCLLAIFAESRKFSLRNGQYVGYPAMTDSLMSVLLDIYELWSRQIVGSDTLVLVTYDLINPARIVLHGISGRLYRLMELNSIPPADLEEVAQFLR